MGNNKSEIVYKKLREKVIHLNVIWKTYNQLFDQTKTTTEILNRSGKSVFGYLQVTMLDDLILIMSKLLDKKEYIKENSVPKVSLCFEKLNELIESDPKFNETELTEGLKGLKNKFTKFNKWRNRRIAHYRFDDNLGITQLPKLPYIDFLSMIEAINDYFRLYDKLLDKKFSSHEHSYSVGDGALLLERLRFAMEYDKYNTIIKHFKMVNIIDHYLPIEELKNLTIHEVLERINEKRSEEEIKVAEGE